MRFGKKLLSISVIVCVIIMQSAFTALAQESELPPPAETTETPEEAIDSQFFQIENGPVSESDATLDNESEIPNPESKTIPESETETLFSREFNDDYSLNPYFPDVQVDNQYFIAIQFLKHNGMIQGYPDGTFNPDREINRAEALKVLLEALPTEIDTSNQNTLFPDVTPKEWYYLYVVKAFNRGLVQGYPDKMFHPENTINRAEALKITLLHEESELPVIIEEPPFPDVPVDAWFSAYAQTAKERTLILDSRDTGQLYPENLMTRGEFCELIYRLIKSRENHMFGRASWYGDKFAGRSTSSGEIFDPELLTAAHRTIPLGTYVKVINTANGNEVVVKVNDRGPYSKGKHMDLSRAAFEALAPISRGIIQIEYTDVSELQQLNNLEYGF